MNRNGRPSGRTARVFGMTAAIGILAFAARGEVQVGQALPDLKAAGLEGRLPDVVGRVVLVDLWASWCAPCRKSFPFLDTLQRDFGPKGFVVLGVNLDDEAEDMRRFLEANPVAFAVVRDASKQYVERLGIDRMPTSLLVDRKGVVRFIHAGFHEGKTETVLRSEIARLLEEP